MPVRVWVSDGLALDAIIDPALGAPYANTKDVGKWPDLVSHILEHPEKLQALPVAEGYSPQHKQAVLAGINCWKQFDKNGISFELSDDPMEADIHVFFVNHFVDQRGMALFQNDIRGYTSKRSFPYQMIMQGKQMPFKPVVILLRTTDKPNIQISLQKMRAAAAHEFGHALGIEGHSSNPHDLMSIYYGNGNISPNDAATVRYLYKLTPDLVP